MRRDGCAQRLPQYDDLFSFNVFYFEQIFQGCFRVLIETRFGGFSITASIAPILHRKDVCRRAAQEFVEVSAISDVPRVSVKRQKSEFGVVRRNPPSVQLGSVGSVEPNFLPLQSTRIPVTAKPVGIVGEKEKVRFKETNQKQSDDVGDKKVMASLEIRLDIFGDGDFIAAKPERGVLVRRGRRLERERLRLRWGRLVGGRRGGRRA